MDLKAVIETGSEVLAEQVEKVTASVSPSLATLAESAIGKQIASVVASAAEKAEHKLEAREHDESSPAPAAPAASSPAPMPAPAAAPPTPPIAATEGVATLANGASGEGSGPRKALVIGGAAVLAGATAAAAVVVYRRRRSDDSQAAGRGDADESVVTPIARASSGGTAGGLIPESQGDQADVTDQTTAAMGADYAAELDAEAEHFVEDFVNSIDDDEEILDPELAVEIDVEADHFAQELIDHIEVAEDQELIGDTRET